jgi:capsular polysaccharide transport system permease protein
MPDSSAPYPPPPPPPRPEHAAEGAAADCQVVTDSPPNKPGPGVAGIFLMRIMGKTSTGPREQQLARRRPAEITPSLSPAPPSPPKGPGFFRRHFLFGLCVVLPTALAAVYFGYYASDIFVSESSYVVRGPNKKASSSGLNAMLEGMSAGGLSNFARSQEDVHTIGNYIRSRDALAHLDRQLDLKTAWQSENIDLLHRFDPFDWDDSQEALYEYYLKRVSAHVDPASGITTLISSAFDPQTALEMNKLLLAEAERLVNVLNERARNDLIRFASKEVGVAEEKAKAAAEAVSKFRNSQSVVDPEKQTELHFAQISRLQDELIKTQAQLTQLRVFAPDSPHPPALELRARTLENEIAKETEKITGGDNSLASKAAQYERLALERQFADQQLASALASLEVARNEAQRQQLYLETIAKPSLPDEAVLPKRIRGVVTTFVLGLVAWGIFAMLLAGVREHQY